MIARRSVILSLAALAWPAGLGAASNKPVIAAASDLKFVMEDLLVKFTLDTGYMVDVVFGASGNLAQQIMNGAPYELFFSADESYVLQLEKRGLTKDSGARYAQGRLALFAFDRHFPLDEKLQNVAAAIKRGEIRHLSIANPDYAPYGRAAKEVLETLDLWQVVRPVLVYGENAAQSLQFVISGAAEIGLVPHSLVLAPKIRSRGVFIVIPADFHQPLFQRLVLTKRAGIEAAAFYRYVLQEPQIRKFREYGFDVPQ